MASLLDTAKQYLGETYIPDRAAFITPSGKLLSRREGMSHELLAHEIMQKHNPSLHFVRHEFAPYKSRRADLEDFLRETGAVKIYPTSSIVFVEALTQPTPSQNITLRNISHDKQVAIEAPDAIANALRNL